MSMRFMQRHQEKVRSAANYGDAAAKPRADVASVPVSEKPATGSAAPTKRAAPVPGRRSFGGFNPHIQAPSRFTIVPLGLFYQRF
jgi:hypothetical protein